ncbi:hypothetical protein HK104_011477 [Borealophlyctis nickersoniae]|nr:hypothetical protein HK104_011477 [Borealophlyctis nickersoniae]
MPQVYPPIPTHQPPNDNHNRHGDANSDNNNTSSKADTGRDTTVIEGSFEPDPTNPPTTTPVDMPPAREFYTADMNPSILNRLYGQTLKLLHVAAAFSPAAFVKNPGAALRTGLRAPSASSTSGAKPTLSLNNLKLFLLQDQQRRRTGATENPTTSSVPVANRQYLSPQAGPPQRQKKVQMLRVMHARSDAEAYKQPVSQLFSDYFAVRPTTMSGWQSIVEERIAMARREGQFDDLPGRGKPIDMESDDRRNPFITPTEFFMHRMVKAQGYVPPWIELGNDIEDDTKRLRKELRSMWSQHCRPQPSRETKREESSGGWTGMVKGRWSMPVVPGHPTRPVVDEDADAGRKYWETHGRKWADLRIAEINEKIRKFNVECPTGIPQKFKLVVDRELERAEREAE